MQVSEPQQQQRCGSQGRGCPLLRWRGEVGQRTSGTAGRWRILRASDSHTSVDPDSESQRLDNGSWDQSVLLSVVVSDFHASIDPDSEYSINVGSWDQSVLLPVVESDSHTSADPDSESQRLDNGSWDQSVGVVVGCRN